MPELLEAGPANAAWTLLLAHGAGAGMETAFLSRITDLIVQNGVRVVRFEFGYMASRRHSGKKKPAPKAETLASEFETAVAAVHAGGLAGRLAVGGKSMGGRVASLVADNLFAADKIAGLVCLGYPFHPPGMPEKTRTAHLEGLSCPTLVVQGERDPFGSRPEVETYALSKVIELNWIGDGDHDFGPRGSSGFTRKGNLATAASAVASFLRSRA